MAGKVFKVGKYRILMNKEGIAVAGGNAKKRFVYADALDSVKNVFSRNKGQQAYDQDQYGEGQYTDAQAQYVDPQQQYDQDGQPLGVQYDPQFDPYAAQADVEGEDGFSQEYPEDPYAPVEYQQKWYEKEWVIWLLLIACPPVGIFIMWKLKYYRMDYRTWLTAGSGLWCVVLLFMLFGGRGDPVKPAISYTNPPIEAIKTATPTDTPTPTPTADPAATTDNTDPDSAYTNPDKTLDIATQQPLPSGITSTDMVWDTKTGKFFHEKSNCSKMTGAAQENVMDAIRRGLTACPVCILKTTDKLPSGNTPTEVAPARVTATPKATATPKLTPTKKPTATPRPTATKKPTPTPKPTSLRLYATKDGQYYHIKSNCDGLKNAKAFTPKQIKGLKPVKVPCPVCKPPTLSAL